MPHPRSRVRPPYDQGRFLRSISVSPRIRTSQRSGRRYKARSVQLQRMILLSSYWFRNSLFLLRSFRQSHDELRAFIRLTRNRDLAAVRFHHGFDQAQAEAEAALRTALVATIEARPNLFVFLRGDAHAGVAEERHGLTRFIAHTDGHTPILGRVLDGVV